MSTCSEDDTASTVMTTSSASSDSICNELDDLLRRCEQLHEHIHNSTKTLHAIHQLVATGGGIKITIDCVIRDFDELLEELHEAALKQIRSGEQNTFGSTLLAVLEKGCIE